MPPVILRVRNIQIVIRTDDHGNPHVHAIGPGAEAKVYLDGAVARSRGFSQKDIRLITNYVVDKAELLRDSWLEIHGEEE